MNRLCYWKWPGIRYKRGGPKIGVAFILVACLVLCVAGTAIASSGGGHDTPDKKWIATDTYRVINFLVLAIALFFVLKKPVAQALSGRIQGIKDQLDELEAKKKSAEKRLVGYDKKLSLLETETQKIIEEYIRQGEEAKVRILKEAELAAEKLEEQAKRNIAYEFEQAKKRLQGELIEKALVRAEQIVKSQITDDDQERIVDEYLEKVVA